MSKKHPTFSIVLTCLNSSKTLGRCILSILDQKNVNKELIIIDGGSTDGSKEIISAFEREIAYYESVPDRGIYHAFNKGIRNSNGKWLYFMGADDFLWDNNVLERVARHLQDIPPSVRFIYGRIQHMGVTRTVLWATDNKWEENRNYSKMPIDHQALFHNKSLFPHYGLFDERFPLVADYEFQLRTMFRHREPCCFIPVTICGHLHGGKSTTRRRRFVNLREAERLRTKYGVMMPFVKRFYKHTGALFWTLFSLVLGERSACRTEEPLISWRYSRS